MSRVVLFLCLVGAASAACPNGCSGHGTCGEDAVCTCFKDWGSVDEEGGDCSEKYCPYEVAWVDTPDASGNFHNYLECAGKGICDRSTGECDCLDGYTGKGCQRSTCPGDCSGHGTCEYIEELTYGPTGSVQAVAAHLWDQHKSMACKCDPGWFEIDCSKRMCRTGNDVLDTRRDTSTAAVNQKQVITLFLAGDDGTGTNSAYSDIDGKTIALTFVSSLNESFTTSPIYLDSTSTANMETAINASLAELPNKVIDTDGVDVAVLLVTGTTGVYLQIEIEFIGPSVHGKQHLIIPETDECLDGCFPKITGLDVTSMDAYSNVVELVAADYNNYECGRRGKCDYSTGICECFTGYIGETCDIQSALV